MNFKKISLKGPALSKSKGFTLIEILIVIGIIAVLAAIVLVAINPARQFRKANNSQRTANVNAILNAIGQYTVDHKGDISDLDIPSGTDESDADEIKSDTGGANVCSDLVPKYIPALPADPKKSVQSITDCSSYSTDYWVFEEKGRVTVIAKSTEDEDDGGVVGDPDDYISVTR